MTIANLIKILEAVPDKELKVFFVSADPRGGFLLRPPCSCSCAVVDLPATDDPNEKSDFVNGGSAFILGSHGQLDQSSYDLETLIEQN